MKRRELLGASIAVGVLAVTGSARAQTKPAGGAPAPAAAPKNDARRALLAALAECQRTGEECVAHCAGELGRGNKEMDKCNRTVHEMLAVTHAMTSLAALDSPRAKELAALCAKICGACKDACAEHKPHFAHGMHLECKACMEACEKCEAACKAYAA